MFDSFSLLAVGMPDLSVLQYSIVDNIFSMTVATMGAAAIFLFLSRPSVDEAYRPALMVSGLVVTIACYHYFMIRHSWSDAYMLAEGGEGYVGTGAAFNDFYRYADWILTVPLLMVELIAVLRLQASKARSLLTRLVIAAALMIALGYPGEVISSPEGWTTRVIWGALSSVPFFYILYVLWTELTASLDSQPAAARKLIEIARLVLLITWAVYPIAYALGGTVTALEAKAGGAVDAGGIVGLQVGYAIADMTAKAGFGMLIYFIARAKSTGVQNSVVGKSAESPEVAAT
ncbi:Green-light absorbing proteorhodopsin precursor [Rubripirellula obstinata]|uniref:Green-light absorbing proteorhodopsin n=1 Tax=Rubripirellula obstinata TaxID=406547 RepID=A0A5B1CBZ2_9BACT|nr:bacteriorhodopsin-like [Rubripirellula obstinata]KAA1258688.1 Green-light absorbing proteorhodopsin precursor [Rubripirellula obstinata]